MADGSIPLTFPYVGIRPDTLRGLSAGNNPIRQILSVENLASFNEAAQDQRKPGDLLIVYVAGNPTPAFLAAYSRIVPTLQPARILHWGDIDVGGFRIAGRLADSLQSLGYRLELWQMNPSEVALDQRGEVDKKIIDEALRLCQQYGWYDEAVGLAKTPVFQEQEFLDWIPPSI